MPGENSCILLLKQIHDELEKQANNGLRAYGLTMAQMYVLMQLRDAEGGQLPLKTLEKGLHVAQSTAAGLVTRLEQKGLVECFGDAGDRRIKMVRLAEAGAAICADSDAHMTEVEARIRAAMTEAEWAIFQVLLQKLRDSFQ